LQAEALPLSHPFCSFCAWCISCGNAPCAKTAKNLSGRRRRPCSKDHPAHLNKSIAPTEKNQSTPDGSSNCQACSTSLLDLCLLHLYYGSSIYHYFGFAHRHIGNIAHIHLLQHFL